MKTPDSVSLLQRAVHWLTAALVFFNLLLPDGMNAWNRSIKKAGVATADQVASANIHAYVGTAACWSNNCTGRQTFFAE